MENGTAGIFAPEILKGVGCEVIELDCKLDWSFPKYNPNPEDLKNVTLQLLKRLEKIMQILVLVLMVMVIDVEL